MFVTLTCTQFERSLSPVLDVLHEWLDSWSGIGVIERGMARQGYDLQLTRYANEGWRATFYVTGREHDPGDGLGVGADAWAGPRRGVRRHSGRQLFETHPMPTPTCPSAGGLLPTLSCPEKVFKAHEEAGEITPALSCRLPYILEVSCTEDSSRRICFNLGTSFRPRSFARNI